MLRAAFAPITSSAADPPAGTARVMKIMLARLAQPGRVGQHCCQVKVEARCKGADASYVRHSLPAECPTSYTISSEVDLQTRCGCARFIALGLSANGLYAARRTPDCRGAYKPL